LRIGLAPGATNTWLNLREVQLYDKAGNIIPSSKLVANLSTTALSDTGASVCVDGSLQNTFCHTGNGDTNPSLTISYECGAAGTTSSTLFMVEVYNREDSCCKSRIASFAMSFFNRASIKDVPDYRFGGSKSVYTILGGCSRTSSIAEHGSMQHC
jgi:hypothetical protein